MKTIIEMAREADALPYLASSGPRHLECLTRFAALVKAAHTAELLEAVAHRAWFDQDHGARWLLTLWPEEERLDVEWQPLFTADQLREAVAAAVLREREECATVCKDAVASIWEYHDTDRKEIGTTVCNNLADAIRNRSNT